MGLIVETACPGIETRPGEAGSKERQFPVRCHASHASAEVQGQLIAADDAFHWPDGRQSAYKDGGYRADFLAGKLPGFLPGVRLERQLDDGSAGFDQRWQKLFG